MTCFGYNAAGQLVWTKSGTNKIEIRIDARVEMLNLAGGEHRCEPVSLVKELTLEERKLDELTPWEGKGGNMFEEGNRVIPGEH